MKRLGLGSLIVLSMALTACGGEDKKKEGTDPASQEEMSLQKEKAEGTHTRTHEQGGAEKTLPSENSVPSDTSEENDSDSSSVPSEGESGESESSSPVGASGANMPQESGSDSAPGQTQNQDQSTTGFSQTIDKMGKSVKESGQNLMDKAKETYQDLQNAL